MKRILLILVLVSFLIGCSKDTTEPEEKKDTQIEDIRIPVQTGTCIDNLNERCAGPPGLECLESSLSTNIITLLVRNNLGSTIELISFDSYDEEEPWSCMTRCMVESVEVNVDGYVDISNHPEIANGQVFEINIRCSGTEYIDQGFELSYTNIDKGMDSKGYFRIEALQKSE